MWVTPDERGGEFTSELGFVRRVPELAPEGASCIVGFAPNGREKIRILWWGDPEGVAEFFKPGGSE